MIMDILATGLDFINSERNFREQQKANAWNRKQQEITWQREDNAVQRRAADMEAAGINPIMAAGAPAQAGPAVRLEAPQRNFNAMDKVMASMALMTQKAQIGKTEQERELTEVLKKRAELGTVGDAIANERAQKENLIKDIELATLQHDWNLVRKSGRRSTDKPGVQDWINQATELYKNLLLSNQTKGAIKEVQGKLEGAADYIFGGDGIDATTGKKAYEPNILRRLWGYAKEKENTRRVANNPDMKGYKKAPGGR